MHKPKHFRTIKQPANSGLCLACVAAMAVGKGLRYVLNRVPLSTSRLNGRKYCRRRDILAFLGKHGIYCGFAFAMPRILQRHRQLTDVSITMPLFTKWPAMLYVKENQEWDHVVFWDGKHVRDPCPFVPEISPLFDYQVKIVVPLTYSETEAPDRTVRAELIEHSGRI